MISDDAAGESPDDCICRLLCESSAQERPRAMRACRNQFVDFTKYLQKSAIIGYNIRNMLMLS